MWFLVFTQVLYTVKEGFKAPPEAVHEASNPRIRVLVIEGRRREQKETRLDDGTCDGTERAWMGKDNERVEMVPVIVHMWRYAISKGRRKKWGRNRHACNIQDGPSVTFPFPITCCITVLV